MTVTQQQKVVITQLLENERDVVIYKRNDGVIEYSYWIVEEDRWVWGEITPYIGLVPWLYSDHDPSGRH